MSTQDAKLPTNRMIYVEGPTDERSILVDADEILSVTRYDERPMLINPDRHYSRGLTINLRNGKGYQVETAMTVREFEMERAKKFVPVAPAKSESERLQGAGGWEIGEAATQWVFKDPDADCWVEALDMAQAIAESQRLGTPHRAIMRATLTKEWGPNDD